MKQHESQLELLIYWENIQQKENTKFLGMTLNSRLNWKEHLKELKVKASHSMQQLVMVTDDE